MNIQDYYQKYLASSMHKRFNDLNYCELKIVKQGFSKYELSQDIKSIKTFVWSNAITIITLIIGVLAISHGIAFIVLKTMYPDA
jgi:hypothetical protein